MINNFNKIWLTGLLLIQTFALIGLTYTLINANIRADHMDDTIGFFSMICIVLIIFYGILGLISWSHIRKIKNNHNKYYRVISLIINTLITVTSISGILYFAIRN